MLFLRCSTLLRHDNQSVRLSRSLSHPMPDLLLELFCEEIPARMQGRAAEELRRLVTGRLVERGLAYDGAIAFVTPRRLALHVAGLPIKGADTVEERRGPRVGAPEAALKGFLKSAGLADIAQARIVKDAKKGEFYAARIERPGEATIAVIAEIVPSVIASFPWPKSMRFGPQSRAPDSLRWVRPLRTILCTFGPETEDPEVVHFEIGGIASGDVTFGHRVMGPKGPIRVRRLADYAASLEKAKVVLDAARRRDIIAHEARNLSFAAGLELVEDEALLEEVAGLVEWPVVLMGSFDADYLAIPHEVIRATIRANQKCFVLRDAEGRLSNRFVLTANLEAEDGGAAIVAGNQRVVRARLADAKYFWETDQKPLPDSIDKASKPLDQRLAKLEAQAIVFHAKLGTQHERILRIAALAQDLSVATGADPALAERAAMLAKADLVTEMVGEFPELQGVMGRYYAALQGEPPSVAAAIEEHYKPLGPSDRVPSDPVSDHGRARRQARHARRLLGDRGEADGIEGPLRLAARRARRHPPPRREPHEARAHRGHRTPFRGPWPARPQGNGRRPPFLLRRAPQGAAARQGRTP